MLYTIRNLVLFSACVSAASIDLQQSAQEQPEPEGQDYLASQTAYGFYLMAHVSRGRDTHPPVNGLILQGYHVGASIDAGIFHATDAHNPGRVFYINGTNRQYTAITDAGMFPYGLTMPRPGRQNQGGVNPVMIQAGSGTPAHVAQYGPDIQLVNELGVGTYLACDRPSAYYRRNLLQLEYSYSDCRKKATGNKGGKLGDEVASEVAEAEDCSKPVVPSGCAAIVLVPHCTALPPMHPGPGNYINHKYARRVPCM
ncbi:hypothetical protein CMQ_6836 [Grosmannia clavigera kw1407]|uniref:DUF7907 domain-containing protein n=1 Tax=Grosmannia clavigera (strain kw1407 / UAMH 11150) TaxID=655863 RepID=F0X7L9_GROCL|nr:uncharacterized protein CMQ_6836 [Grosmannia clavigera kw1407]EFX06515.1 hypothetical protein CMQ_6836 [Grosmannia clavigera kw1407]